MGKLRYAAAAGVGHRQDSESSITFKNHFASATPIPDSTRRKIASMGLQRVAGNVYECPSTQDFWQVAGGKIMRLSGGDEVDNGESIAAAPKDQPLQFLESILDDLSFS
jgi:hypothetical protein